MATIGQERGGRWEHAAWIAFLGLFAATTLAVAKIPFFPDSNPVVDRFSGAQFVTLTFMTAITTIIWIVGWFKSKCPLRFTGAHLASAALCITIAVSARMAAVLPLAIFGESGRYIGLVTWVCCLLTFFLASQLVNRPQRLQSITYVAIVVGTIEALIAISQVLGLDILRFEFPVSVSWVLSQGIGTLGNPNHLASILVGPFILACSEALSLHHRVQRGVVAISAVIMALSLVISATRGAWIGALVGVLVLVALMLRCRTATTRTLLIGALSLVVVVIAGGWIGDSTILGTRFAIVDNSIPAIEQLSNGRTVLWQQSAAVFSDSPLFGVGPDSLRNAFKTAGQSTGIVGVFTDDPHSLPILIVVSFGVVGLALALWLLVTSALGAIQRVKNDPRCAKAETLSRMNAWLAAAVGLSTTALVSVVSIPMLLSFMLVLGVIHAPYVGRSQRMITPKLWIVAGVSIVAGVFFLFSVFVSSLSLTHNLRITAADMTIPLPADSIRVLDDADRALPWRYEMMSRRTARLIEHSRYEYLQGQNDQGRGSSRLAALCSELDERIALYPGEYFAWLTRAEAYTAAAELSGDPSLVERAREALAQAQQRFPNDPELMELAGFVQQL